MKKNSIKNIKGLSLKYLLFFGNNKIYKIKTKFLFILFKMNNLS